MLTPDYLRSKFEAGKPYDDYVASGKPHEIENWRAFEARVSLTPEQARVLGGFERRVNLLVSSGTWCGDCVQQIPMLKHIETANPERIVARYLDRDEHSDLAEQIKICSGTRVPVVLLLNEDFDFLALAGDRTLSRYRSMAARQLAGACPLPGAPVPADEIAATLQDWVDEVERAHLICRLSTKLRARYND